MRNVGRSVHSIRAFSSARPTITYTETDEAPMLATYSFLPIVLFNQFKYFFNLFFLLIALSQIIPALRVGFLISFVAPLVFVLAVTMVKEFYDDLQRYKKDTQINDAPFFTLNLKGGVIKKTKSQRIRVGDLVVLHPNEPAPADMILLWTSDPSGSLFIRTD